MRRPVVALSALTLLPGLALAQAAPAPSVDPLAAPAPAILLAQVDDADLEREETLEELQNIEYKKDAWSMPAAIGLSMVPGAGWGLIYAEKKAQSTVPFVLSVVGYGVGALYLAGLFDESSEEVCLHDTAGRVDLAECGYGDVEFDPTKEPRTDNNDIDPRDPQMRPYFATKGDYTRTTVGEDFDGAKTGLIILGATYAVTSAIGAIWSGSVVAEHNDSLRKDIESTASRDAVARRSPAGQPVNLRPIIGVSDDRGVLGLGFDF
ncbi:MAG: hypothetical protein KC620_01340 [Myxococcales bacterium]|nr:hypothetical protein [Myxococcales bacterium]